VNSLENSLSDELFELASEPQTQTGPGVATVRVLHVCETATGGVGTYQNQLGRIAEPWLQQQFLVPSNHRHMDEGLPLLPYPASRRGIRSLVEMLIALRHAMRTTLPHVVFFHSTFSLLGLAFVRLLFPRTRTVYCAHGWAVSRYSDTSCLEARVVRSIEGTLCGLADVVVNISQHEADLAQGFGYLGRHIVIENAVTEPVADARCDLFAAEPNAVHLLFVGRFDRQKGLDVLLAAFDRARLQRPDLRLHIVGATVRQDGGAIPLPLGATLAGWVDKTRIDDWYRSADALVVPSRWEGFGLVVPEALRNGTPVLCSDRGALPGLVSAGSTGEVFALDVDSLAALLIGLNADQLRSMRSASRSSFEARFHHSRQHKQLAELLSALATRGPE
jgi:glycosyltransferase involved in cell wall biosynthesis